jgi:hypothetical protein
MNTKNLVRLYESEGGQSLREVFRAEPSLFRGLPLAKVFEACFSPEAYRRLKEAGAREAMGHGLVRTLTEAEGAVSTSAFLNITGQIVYSWVMDPLPGEEDFPFSQIIPDTGPVMTLQEEKVPGLTRMGDVVQPRYEGDPYALAGFGEDWINRPAILDRGVIVPLTWEAVFEDKTGQLQQRAGEVGYWMRVNREKRAIDCVIDQNTTAHRYKWRGVTIASYNDNTGTHTWDNLAATNGLVDWTQINTAKQVFNSLTDPYTAEPLNVTPKHLVAAMGLEQTALRILSASEIRVTTPGYATSGNPTQTVRDNPYRNYLQLVSSRLLGARMAAASELATDWFVGDLAAYARYFWAEKMDVTQAPPDHPDNFHRRIVQQYRVNERGEYAVVQPRAMVKSTVA